MSTRRRTVAALALIALVGLLARVWNLDWDRGQHLHPDERHWSFVLDDIEAPDGVGQYFDTQSSPLNPYRDRDTFVYGTLPLFTTKAVASVLTTSVAEPLVEGLDRIGVDLLDDDGAARFDAEYRANLVGRLLTALADTATIVVVGLIGWVVAGRRVALFGAGAYALAVLPIQQAHFLGADSFTTMFVAAAVLAALLHVRRGGVAWLLAAGALAGAATACRLQAAVILVVVVVAALVRARAAAGSVGRAVAGILGAGALAVVVFRVANPYAFDGWGLNQQWLDDLRRLRDLQAGADVPPSIQWVGRTPLVYPMQQLVLWGLGPALTVAALIGAVVGWRRRSGQLLLLAVWIGGWLVIIATSWTPTMRYLLPIYPALAVLAGIGFATLFAAARRARPARLVGGGALAVLAALWCVAFVAGVYGRPNSRVEATEWLAANVPAGSVLSVDGWDDALPLGLGPDVPPYELEALNPFDPDSAEKVERHLAALDRIDWVVVSSQRARASVERLPARFPAMLRYYDALEDGSLGFERVAEFQNEPQLGPLGVDTEGAEEAFSVYDHPPVEIYRKTDAYSTANARRILDPASAELAVAPDLRDGGANALLARPDEAATAQSGATFDEVLHRGGAWAVVLWVLWWALLAASALPLTTLLAPRLSAGAMALAVVLGPLAVVGVVWSLVAWKVVGLSTGLIWIVTAAVVVAGSLVGQRRWPSLRRAARVDGRAWMAVIGVAAAVFAAVLALRAANPDLWHPARGGEKPMEMAYFTSIARTTQLPALDPWFAGGVLNYYYAGWFVLAVPTRALGILPEVAYQLGLATVAALAAATAMAVAHDAVALTRRRKGRLADRPSGRAPVVAGLVSVAVLLAAGNLDTVRQAFGWVGSSSGPLDWWATSRVHDGVIDITEFPAWSMVFGDLHPHVMGLVTTGLVVLLALAVAVAPLGRRRWVLLGLAGAALGLVRMVHTWDLPMAALIVVAAVAWSRSRRRTGTLRHTIGALALELLVVGAVAQLVTAPYRGRGLVFNSGVDPAPATTAFADQLVHLGALWAVALVFAVAVHHRAGGVPGRRLLLAAVVAAPAVIMAGLAVSWVASTSAVLVALVASAIWRTRDQRSWAVVVGGGLVAAGIALATVPEVVVVTPDIERMNTVFKLTYQAWQLIAIGIGPAVIVIAGAFAVPATRRVLTTAGAGLLAAGLAFPVLAIGPRLDDRIVGGSVSLDGLDYLRADPVINDPPQRLGEDLALIEWLRANVGGTPTIVEMAGQGYTWAGRISQTTGLPTVIGWPWHQTQQRLGYSSLVTERMEDVERFFTAGDVDFDAWFLRAYGVRYVVIGTQERRHGTPQGLAVIEQVPGTEVVFRSGDHRIIAVDQEVLADALAVAPLAPRS